MRHLTRHLENALIRSLQAFPVVYLAGPRQSGKTTLVQHLAKKRHPATYVTFDDIQLRAAATRDPDAFLRSFSGPVILDEVQLVPEIFRPLKALVDENRSQANAGRGAFLLTGSASVMALPQLSEALVGRMALHSLWPFSACELQNTPRDFIQRAFEGDWGFQSLANADLYATLTQASFPELLSLQATDLRHAWCNGYLNTLLQRDVRNLLEIDKLAALPNLLSLLATRTGGTLNEAALSRATGLNHLTLKKYRTLLEALFLTCAIPAWSHNRGKRLVKSPKIYLSDLNLLLYLLNYPPATLTATFSQQHANLFGQILENFVAIELNKQLAFSKIPAQLYHYRTQGGQEVDFLLEGPQGQIIAIEVKATHKVSAKDFRHIDTLKQDLGQQFLRGFVLHQGNDSVPFGNDLFAVPLTALGALE